MHQEYHSRLNTAMQEVGLPPLTGKTGSKKIWNDVLANPENAKLATSVLKSVSKQFDKEFGTNIFNAVLREMQ